MSVRHPRRRGRVGQYFHCDAILCSHCLFFYLNLKCSEIIIILNKTDRGVDVFRVVFFCLILLLYFVIRTTDVTRRTSPRLRTLAATVS